MLTRVSSLSIQNKAYSASPYVLITVSILLLLKELTHFDFQLKDFFWLILVLIVSTQFFRYGTNWLCLVYLTIFSARNLGLKKTIKFVLISQIIAFSLVVVLYFFHILPEATWGTQNGEKAFGFLYPTYPAHLFFLMTLAIIWLHKDKISFIFLIFLGIVNLFLFIWTQTSSPFILSELFLGWVMLDKNGFHRSNFIFEEKFSIFFVPLLIALYVWIVLGFSHGNRLSLFLNSILRQRVMLSDNGFSNFGVHLLANPSIQMFGWNYTQTIGAQYNFVDSGWLEQLFFYGILVFVFFVVLFMRLFMLAVNYRDGLLALIIVFLTIHALFDPEVFWPDFNAFLFVLLIRKDQFKE